MALENHFSTNTEDTAIALSAPDDIEISFDILTLHLVATGVLQLAERVAKGLPIDSQYPSPLQVGLNRLNVIRYRQGRSLVHSIPDVLGAAVLSVNGLLILLLRILTLIVSS